MLARVSFWAPEGSQPIKVEADEDRRVSVTVGSDVHLLLSSEEALVLFTELAGALAGSQGREEPIPAAVVLPSTPPVPSWNAEAHAWEV